MKYPEQGIGQTGKLAIKPFLKTSRKDLWQFCTLSVSDGEGANFRPDVLH